MRTSWTSRLSAIGGAAALLAGGCVVISTTARDIPGIGVEATETRDPGTFTGVDVTGALDVRITAGPSHEVRVRGDENLLPYVITEVRGDRLILKTSAPVRPRRKLVVEISLPELRDLDASGATTISATRIDADTLEVHCSGATGVHLEGKARRLLLDASGAAQVDARHLEARKAEVEAHGAAGVLLRVEEHLRARASGASDVRYLADAASVDAETSGAASVAKL